MIPKLLAGILLVAILPLPYSYYHFLRVGVSIGCLYLLISNWDSLEDKHKGVITVIMVLFNPFSPVFLTKTIWAVIDITAAFYLFRLPNLLKKQ